MFTCKFCDFKDISLNKKLKHAVLHRNICLGFHCDFNDCKLIYQSEFGLRSHLARDHMHQPKEHGLIDASSQAVPELVCSVSVCQKQFNTYAELKHHLYDHLVRGERVPCPFRPQCEKIYDNDVTMRSHLSRNHRVQTTISDCAGPSQTYGSEAGPRQQLPDQGILEREVPFDDANNEGLADMDVDLDLSTSDLEMSMALFFLKLEAELHIPASSVQTIFSELKVINSLAQEANHKKLTGILKNNGLSDEMISDICISVEASDSLSPCLENLKSTYLRKEYYKRNLQYVEPKEYSFLNENGTLSSEHFYYVPVAETLKAMFTDRNVKEQYQKPRHPNQELLQDFHDGKLYQQNNFLIRNPDSLEVTLFIDAFSVVNPLGSAKKVFKILAIYMALGNCESDWRYAQSNIQLVALCKQKDFEHSQFYGPLVDDLKKLQSEGVELWPGKTVKGTLIFISGDNLGSNGVGGFKENFSTVEYYCRFCVIPRQLFGQDFSFFPRRTIASYNEALSNLEEENMNEGNKRKDWGGVKFDSRFNAIEDFHVVNGLPPCVGHDLEEGCFAYDGALALKKLMKEKWFTLAELNERVRTFKYSKKDKRDKPVAFPKTFEKIPGSASQVRAFIRLFPLFLSDKIKDPSNDVWQLLLIMREINMLVFAPVVRKSCVPYLEMQILDYLDMRATVFEEVPLRPKHHFLQHHAELILEFGPFKKVWTLRFESKHMFFKECIKSSKNFINVLKSLAEKHELFQSYMTCGASYRPPVSYKNESLFNSEMYDASIRSAVNNLSDSPVVQCNEVSVRGTSYRKGEVVVLSQGHSVNDLTLGEICNVLLDTKQAVYLIVGVKNATFDPIRQAYLLGQTLGVIFKPLADLVDYCPLTVYYVGTEPWVVLNHGIMQWH